MTRSHSSSLAVAAGGERKRKGANAMFSQVGPMEIVLVLVVALLILGPKRLPEAGRSLGRGIREFKDSIAGSDTGREIEEAPTARREAGS